MGPWHTFDVDNLMVIPTLILVCITAAFLILERVIPGRTLPQSKGWYARTLSLNAIQFISTFLLGSLWISEFQSYSLLNLRSLEIDYLEGFIGWFVGTFVFYWWHRIRHYKGFWSIFHQVHHSASRIEVLTSFYKHPLEIMVNTFLTNTIIFLALGCSIEAGLWYNLFAATGEYFYHANIKSPKWLRYSHFPHKIKRVFRN